MCAQLLMFQNGVYSQDLCYKVITRFYQIIVASGMNEMKPQEWQN